MQVALCAYLSSIGGVVCQREPVAWAHRLKLELDQFATELTGDPDHPFGEPGEDYSAEFTVNSTPLHAPLPIAGKGDERRAFALGERVRKTKGSSWHGIVVGFYGTKLTPIGYCVESEREPGSVQIYPESALEVLPAPPSLLSEDTGDGV
ncbi:hypothetical protein G6M04_14660 [Agrobacterium rhizogenes]|nr:hypothetical protein [Rhizobium rhizogenes]